MASQKPGDSASEVVLSLTDFKVWKLEDAKARLSEVVRLARDQEPQRITVRGEEAVVVLAAKEFMKLLPLMAQPSLHALLSQSPLSQLDFEQPNGVKSPIRKVEL
ncbi:MAG: type II toxin-antitoxin system prevent-host-death family antitoxin [Cyanobacteria bacterium P01_F01_bin.4]